MSASSTIRAVSLAFGLPSSLSPIARPLTVCVGQALIMLKPTALAAGCLRGMIALVNSPPVASEPVPVAGQRALAAPLRHQGLNSRTGAPPAVVREKSPCALPRRRPDVLQAARRRRSVSFRCRPEERPVSEDRAANAAAIQPIVRISDARALLGAAFLLAEEVEALPPHRPGLIEGAARGSRSCRISRSH